MLTHFLKMYFSALKMSKNCSEYLCLLPKNYVCLYQIPELQTGDASEKTRSGMIFSRSFSDTSTAILHNQQSPLKLKMNATLIKEHPPFNDQCIVI